MAVQENLNIPLQMGYVRLEQTTEGIHTRTYSRQV
jgi:hypothetical protein